MQRNVAGQSTFVITPPLVEPIVAPVIWAPAATGWRTTWPITCEGSTNAPGVIAARSTTLVVTWSARMRVESGMSTDATTTGPVVGATGVGVGPPPRTRTRIPTHATIAKKTPTSRTSRFERFKLVLPEGCVTGGTTLAVAQSRATIPKD